MGRQIVIDSHSVHHFPDPMELWSYRDLLLMYVRRDLVIVYKQTILGPIWYILQPVLMALMLLLVFNGVAGVDTQGIPPMLFYLSGLCLWSYFSNVTNSTAEVFLKNANVFGKVYFPRIIVPLAQMVSNSVKMLLLMLVTLVLYLIETHCHGSNTIHPTASIAMLPLLMLASGLFAMACGLIIAALTVRYRDLYLLVGFCLQLMMFATPVAYPFTAVPQHWRIWIFLNPMSSMIEAARYGAFGLGCFDVGWLAYSLVLVACSLLLGLWLFTRAERTFIDII